MTETAAGVSIGQNRRVNKRSREGFPVFLIGFKLPGISGQDKLVAGHSVKIKGLNREQKPWPSRRSGRDNSFDAHALKIAWGTPFRGQGSFRPWEVRFP